jgi:hypothetical protein
MNIEGLNIIRLDLKTIEFIATEVKFLKKIDLELEIRNPNLVLDIKEKEFNNFQIILRNEFLNIEKRAKTKDECLEKIQKLVNHLKLMTCDHQETGIFDNQQGTK